MCWVRAGPHYSLLSRLALRLQSLVLHSPVLLSLLLWAPVLSPWSTKLLWMCAAIHPLHVVPNHLLATLVKAEHCANLPPQLGQKDSMWYKATET